uniref:Uncharacterized protein n=1 Tax=Anguilla anguilla TaxID=7936 RepID=A0A0E9U034_ANGAN
MQLGCAHAALAMMHYRTASTVSVDDW